MNGNGLERIDIAATRAQFGELCADTRSVVSGNLGICEKREPWIAAPYWVGTFSHGASPVVELSVELYTAVKASRRIVAGAASKGNCHLNFPSPEFPNVSAWLEWEPL